MGKYDKDEFIRLILDKNMPYSVIGKLHGVSGNAIKKIAKNFEIPLPRR